ncbi:MAG TPA: flippase [Candidatus Angelobacter sp.]|nr:flippase [Candidatus Angelobacter sp.]
MSATTEKPPLHPHGEESAPKFSEGIRLTQGRLLAKNTVWNLAGQVLPMLVGVVAVPLLVRRLGLDRFGILSLAWIVVGYFGIFELGIGRALTKLAADKLGLGEHHAIPGLVWTSLILMGILGGIGGLVILGLSRWLVADVLKTPIQLQAETVQAFHWLAFSVPLGTLTSGFRGVLQARQEFTILTFIRVPLSTFSFLGPLLVLPFSTSLVPIIIVLTLARVVGLFAHAAACHHVMPELFRTFVVDRTVLGGVLSFGGWMTVSNVVGPLMTYLDRFLVGTLLSVGAITYYTAPFDMLSRLSLIPVSLTGVLFPALAVSLSQKSERTSVLLTRSEKYIFLAVFPLILLTMSFAPEGLRIWLGSSFAKNGTTVLRWLAAGVFVNSLAQVPFSLIQSAGKPNMTAWLHIVELPGYLCAVWLLTRHFGIEGTAIAFTCRCIADAFVLFIMANVVWPRGRKAIMKLGCAVAGGVAVLYLSTWGTLFVRGFSAPLIVAGFTLITWRYALDSAERQMVLSVFSMLRAASDSRFAE